MALPPEIKAKLKRSQDVAVDLKVPDSEQAIVEGKTGVPFGTFVKLILKRKVQTLFKDWQNEPVIISSELLTRIASAPDDSHEDKSKIILTALVIGLCFGVFVSFVGIFVLGAFGITIGQTEILAGLGVMLLMTLAVWSSMRIQTNKMRQELVDKVEKVSDLFSR